jgi:serine/threonine-protein kinase
MPTSLDPGTVIGGKYRLDRALARGGMGSVWVARHLQLDAPVAIKFMDPTYARSPEARGRFEREARACARVKSPNIIQVHDYGVEGDVPYIAMELLEGEDLGARLRRGRLALAEAAPLALQIGRGLRTAHEAGIVHRDLKPANIFLSRHQDEDVVKVLDFGIAKSLGEVQVGESTTTGTVIGSPHYMSPEQVRAFKYVDHRTDLWSFGVILFRCVTGRLPFPAEQMSAVLVAICTDPIPAPSQIAPDLGPEVDAFFAHALARDPAQRFQSAKEMAEAFAALEGVPASRVGMASLSGSQPSVAAVSGVQPADTGGTLSPAGRSVALRPARRSGAAVAAVVGSVLLLSISAALLVSRLRDRGAPAAAAAPTVLLTVPAAAAPEPSATTAPSASANVPVPDPTPPATPTVSARPPAAKAAPPAAKKAGVTRDPTFGF